MQSSEKSVFRDINVSGTKSAIYTREVTLYTVNIRLPTTGKGGVANFTSHCHHILHHLETLWHSMHCTSI